MSRYIDVEKFLKFENERCNGVALIGTCTMNNLSLGYELSKHLITNADVVDVVRCKDCKYARPLTFEHPIYSYSCGYFNTHSVKANDFCSYGERGEK